MEAKEVALHDIQKKMYRASAICQLTSDKDIFWPWPASLQVFAPGRASREKGADDDWTVLRRIAK